MLIKAGQYRASELRAFGGPYATGASHWLDARHGLPSSGDVDSWVQRIGPGPAVQASAPSQPSVTAGPGVAFASGERMEIADDDALDFGVGSFLVCMSLQRPQVASYQCLWGKGSSGSADNLRGLVVPSHRLQLFWGNDGQSYASSAGTVPDDVGTVIMWGIDASANEVIYSIDGAIERIAITRSGTGANSSSMFLHGDAAGAYGTDSWTLYDWQACKFGPSEAIPDASITAIHNDAATRKGL